MRLPKARRLYVAVQNIQACFTSNKCIFTARKPTFCTIRRILHIVSRCSTELAPRLLRNLSQKHITSSAHQPTLSLRDKLPLTQTPTTDNRPFKQPHHKARANNSAIHAFDRARRTSRSKDTAPLTQTEQIRPKRNMLQRTAEQESASLKPNAAQSASSRRLLVLHPKTSINIDFLPHVSRKTAAPFCIMAAAMPVGITPAAAFRSINRSSASAVYIGLALCTRHTIAEHAEAQKVTSDHPTLAAINLRARHLFCTQERLLAGRRRSFELNRAHYTH